MECATKEDFSFEDLKQPTGLETDSTTGKVASLLQEKAIKLVQRRR